MSTQPRLSGDELSPLYRLRNLPSAVYCILVYGALVAIFVGLHHFPSWPAYIAAFVVVGILQHHMSVIQHEANHFLLFTNRGVNEVVGALTAYLIGFTMSYRKVHFLHHRKLGEETDPDLINYEEYPLPPRAFLGRLLFTLSGLAAVKQQLFSKRGGAGARVEMGGLLMLALVQLALLAVFFLAGHVWFYFFLWIGPLLTITKTLAYLRNVAEHIALPDHTPADFARYRTILCNPVEWVLFAPMHFNYHAEHHFYPGVPYYHLPELHRLLRDKPGYAETVDLEPSYVGCLIRGVRRA